MLSRNYRLIVGVAVVVLLLLPMASFAAEEIVTVKNYGTSLAFIPQVSAEDLILTVTGPCGYELRQSLRVDRELLFKIDETSIDGMYRFEVTAIPKIDGSILDILHDARKTGDNKEVDKLCREGALPGQPQLHASGFTIDRGKIVYDPDAVEDFGGVSDSSSAVPFEKDTVLTNADGTIRNSLCVGFDCLNDNTYSDTTILLTENNTRIKFDDTSSISGFPNRDWEIEANSSASGGGNYFAINDCGASSQGGCATDRLFTLEANAPQHSLYVDSGGRIGNRTSNPVVDFHISDGDTPTLRLEQNATSGFAAQTWDVAGNETNFFVRDATNGSTLPFRIRPGAPSNSIVIDPDGNVGIGTSAPAADTTMHVVANTGAANDVVLMQNNGPTRFALSNTSAGDVWRFNYANSGELRIGDNDANVEFQINGNGDVTISGGLITTGGGGNCTAGDPCDGVFHPDYVVPSIEEHAAAMWQNSHLPAVGPTKPDQPINLVVKTLRMLNELEKAHIYIEQLNGTINSQGQSLEAQQAEIRLLEARLASLEQSN